MNATILLSAIIGGVAITLLTGLFFNREKLLLLVSNTTPVPEVVQLYGYPFPWLVMAPEYFPWRIDVLNLVADVVVCAVIILWSCYLGYPTEAADMGNEESS